MNPTMSSTPLNRSTPFMKLISYEITRLVALREEAIETRNVKLEVMRLLQAMGGGAISERIDDCEAYYKISEKYLNQKLRFWGQMKNGMMDANMLVTLQEMLTEWLEAGWKYLGMDNIKSDSKNAKDEYEMMKKVCLNTPVKPKKKTRRGGKK